MARGILAYGHIDNCTRPGPKAYTIALSTTAWLRDMEKDEVVTFDDTS